VIQLENIKPIALKYIDDLKKTKDKAGMPATDLPSFAVLFGRAYVLSATDLWVDHRNDGSRPAEVSDRSGKRRPVVDVMHVGTQLQHSIMPSVFVATFGSPALILFRAESDLSGGGVLLIPRERQINVGGIYRSNVRRGKGQWVINYPTIQLPDYGSVTIRQSVHDLSE